jgi:hypothetical protein
LLQIPPQHSNPVVQTSPVCVQNEGWLLQTPLLQKFEQHSAPEPQGLPDVLHVVLSGAHFPPPVPFGTQEPPQQSVPTPHAPLSATHCCAAHVPPTHENVQHSLPAPQA